MKSLYWHIIQKPLQSYRWEIVGDLPAPLFSDKSFTYCYKQSIVHSFCFGLIIKRDHFHFRIIIWGEIIFCCVTAMAERGNVGYWLAQELCCDMISADKDRLVRYEVWNERRLQRHCSNRHTWQYKQHKQDFDCQQSSHKKNWRKRITTLQGWHSKVLAVPGWRVWFPQTQRERHF